MQFTSATEGIIEQFCMLFLENRRLIIEEVAIQLQFSHGSAYDIIHDRLYIHKDSVRWVSE
jgi:hypothetical protein